MRKLVLVCALASLVAGCTSEGNVDATTAAGDIEAPAGASDAEAHSSWRLERQTSHMDGDVLSAVRVFEFPDRRSTFVANVSCRTKAEQVLVWVESFVGDPASPEPESAFATVTGLHPFQQMPQLQPQGRLKLPGKEPRALGPYFGLDSGFNNRINFFPIILGNSAFFPMVLEVNNGRGTFELVLDASTELLQVLEACDLGSRVADNLATTTQAPPASASPSARAQPERATASVSAQSLAPEQGGNVPKFTDYSVRESYSGPAAALVLDNDTARDFRSRFGDALSDKPSFAGEYVAVEWGCGTGCVVQHFVNKRTGRVLEDGFGGECGERIEAMRVDSRLLVTAGPVCDDDFNEVGFKASFYVLENERLRLISERAIERPADW